MASDNTEARRERVRTLCLKSDRKIAEILIEEGYGDQPKRTADGRRKQLSAMTRNVCNDRKWWKKQYREQKAATTQDANESRGEYLARLDSLIDEALQLLEDKMVKGTPRVQALSEIRQLEQAKAKALGVAEVPPAEPDGDGENPAPFLGIVVGIDGLSEDAKKRVKQWKKRNEEDE